MKEYKLVLSDKLKEKSREIVEYLMVCQYQDDILKADACAYLLGITKGEFLTDVLSKYDVPYSGNCDDE